MLAEGSSHRGADRSSQATVILADWVITSADNLPHQHWGVRVVDGHIDDVGSHTQLKQKYSQDEVVDGTGKVLLAGFVNAHVHLYGVLAHGIPVTNPPDGFWSFLNDYWWPKVEDALDHQMIEAAADWACVEMLSSGTTTFYDILEAPKAVVDSLAVEAEVAHRRGMRSVLSFEATQRAGPQIAAAALEENVRHIVASAADPNQLVTGMMCYHTAFTCSADYITDAVGLAADHGVLCHAHCNEGVHEAEWCVENIGVRTLEYYEQLGIASSQFLASQCVQLSDREIDIIGQTGIRVTHMPLANCEVGGGIAPISELLDLGVTVGLGSDGYINDFFAVMRGAFLVHKARLQDPGVMPAATVLRLATEGGANALGLEKVGRLQPGWKADLQLVDADFATPITEHNLFEQLVLWRNHTHVTDVMVNGHWKVRRGEVLGVDKAEMTQRLHVQAKRLWANA